MEDSVEFKQWLPDEELRVFKILIKNDYIKDAATFLIFGLELSREEQNLYDLYPSVEGDLLADKLNNATKEQLSEEYYYDILRVSPLCYKECRDALIEIIIIDPQDATFQARSSYKGPLKKRFESLFVQEKNPLLKNFIKKRLDIWKSYVENDNSWLNKLKSQEKTYSKMEQLSKTDPEQAFKFAIDNKLHLDSGGILFVMELTDLCEDARSKYLQIGLESVALLEPNSDGPFSQIIYFVLEEKKYGVGFLNDLITKIREKKSNEELFFANALIASHIESVSKVLDIETAKPFRDAANSLVSILIKDDESLYSAAEILYRGGSVNISDELKTKIGHYPEKELEKKYIKNLKFLQEFTKRS